MENKLYNVFQVGYADGHICISFAQLKDGVKENEITDTDVENVNTVYINPEQLMGLVEGLFTVGMRYQQESGHFIGFPTEENDGQKIMS